MSADLTDADYQALARFRHGLRVFLQEAERAARETGLTPAQHQLLLAVRGHAGGAPSISELAENLQLQLHSTVELVGRAAAAGLVERRPDPDDARRQLVRLTPLGRERLAELYGAHRDQLHRFRTAMVDVLGELR